MAKNVYGEDVVECFYNGTVVKVPVKIFASALLGIQIHDKKYVRYKDGSQMYGMCPSEFFELVHDADAVYKHHNKALVNIEILDNFMEYFRE